MSLLNIQDKIFFLTLLFLPTQLGKHFWPDFSVVLGIRIDYLSPTIYVTDVFIILLFVFYCLNSRKSIKKVFSIKYLVLSIFLLVGIVFSKSPALGFYGLLKLLEFGFFGFYTASYLRGKNQSLLGLVTTCFAIGIIFESFLGIAHYLNQGSIGGVLYFFGEREFNQITPGIANASINGELMLRPYGTFPHPNVLAGYLVIAMAITISKLKDQISKIKKTFYFLVLVIGTVALFLTMSRVAILVWIVFLIIFFLKKIKLKFKLLIGAIIILALLSLISFNLFPQRFTDIALTDESVQMRWKLIESSFVMIKNHPVFGVGLNNFLINTTSYLQPVHNIYLLIASETGLIGFFFFAWLIIKTLQRSKKKNFIILSIILVLGMFDHYFLTLQQGQLIFAFVLGLCWTRSL